MTLNLEDPRVWFIAGLVVAAIFGWFNKMYKGWVKNRDAYKKPQSVVQTTKKTPAEVAREAAVARRNIGIMWLAIFAAIWVFLEFNYFPGMTASVVNGIMQFIDRLVSNIGS